MWRFKFLKSPFNYKEFLNFTTGHPIPLKFLNIASEKPKVKENF